MSLKSEHRGSGHQRRCQATSGLSITCAILAVAGIDLTRSGWPIYDATVKGRIPSSRPSRLPQAIDLQPGDAVPVNRHLSLLFDGDRVVYFVFAPHRLDDFRFRNG